MVVEAGAQGAIEERLSMWPIISTPAPTRSSAKSGAYRPLEPTALYLGKEELAASLAGWPAHTAQPFPSPTAPTR
jgi:transcription-repair coupling factor (superfamily II helicase)